MGKRLFDLVFGSLGLVVTSPLLLVSGLAVMLSSRGPIFFRQERIGRNFIPFRIIKFRTMVDGATGPPLTARHDPRVTRIGRFLRRLKFDELPQLVNVIKGDMSLVGPRPEVRQFVERFRSDYEEILTIRPGITDEASLVYRHEGRILAQSSNPEEKYISEVLPKKIALAKEYVHNHTMWRDVGIILRTLVKV